ncbi:hypothetical protein Pfo_018705 [Paulownia fortunei]|nr:hypothetical protein Pfo_018705 [Paulownia fortunei]
MGRKIDMKKIEDVTKCQANEIAVCCDVDVAFVAFSPSGRVSKFCNQRRIEDVLHRYLHIKAFFFTFHFQHSQICQDYELGPEQEPSLHQLSWCERNLNHSLERVIARKMDQMELESRAGKPFSSNFNETEQVSAIKNPFTGQILMQLDPWISPYRFTSITTITTNASRVEMPQSLNDEMGTGLECTNSNLSQLGNMEVQEIGQLNMDYNNSFSNGNPRNDNVEDEDCCRIINCNEIHKSDQSQAPYHVHPHNEVCQNTQFDNLLAEDTQEDDTLWTTKMQKSSLWEWENLLLDENFNLQDFL